MKILENFNKNSPKIVSKNLCNLVIAGSRSYCCANDKSDYDIYGFFMPPKQHIRWLLTDASNPKILKKFKYKTFDLETKTKYEFFIYNFLDYINMLKSGHPFLIESLFSDKSNVLFNNDIGKLIYSNKHKFLTSKCIKTFIIESRRKFSIFNSSKNQQSYFPLKQVCHAIRLLNECEQIIDYKMFKTTREIDDIKSIKNKEFKPNKIKKIYQEILKRVKVKFDKMIIINNDKLIENLILRCIYKYYSL